MLIGGIVVALIAAAVGAVALAGPLEALDFVLPKDREGQLVLRDAAYGTNPRQRLDVYAPTEPGPEPAPIVVYFYGGSWASGAKDGYDFLGRALAAKGFVVVVADYRLVPEVRFPSFVEDGAAAVAWARANAADLGADPDRIAIIGHSAGAYIAAMLALDQQWLAASGVPRSAIRAFAGLAGPYDFLPLDVDATINAFGAAPDPAATQPINFVDVGDPPAFLAAGADDRTVLPRNSIRLAALLTEAGIPVQTRIYPGIGHLQIMLAIARPLRSWAPVLEDLSAFLTNALARPGE